MFNLEICCVVHLFKPFLPVSAFQTEKDEEGGKEEEESEEVSKSFSLFLTLKILIDGEESVEVVGLIIMVAALGDIITLTVWLSVSLCLSRVFVYICL